jgi:hypothetical protein
VSPPVLSSLRFFEPEGELSAVVVWDALSIAISAPPHPNEIERWTAFERLLAYDFAMREHYAASGLRIDRRPRPSFILDGIMVQRLVALDGAWTEAAAEGVSAATPDSRGFLSAVWETVSAFRRSHPSIEGDPRRDPRGG